MQGINLKIIEKSDFYPPSAITVIRTQPLGLFQVRQRSIKVRHAANGIVLILAAMCDHYPECVEFFQSASLLYPADSLMTQRVNELVAYAVPVTHSPPSKLYLCEHVRAVVFEPASGRAGPACRHMVTTVRGVGVVNQIKRTQRDQTRT